MFIVLFGLIAGSVSTWLLLEDTSLKRTVIAVLGGIAAGLAAGVAVAVLITGAWAPPDAAVIGSVLGPAAAVVMSRRSYRSRRSLEDLRNP